MSRAKGSWKRPSRVTRRLRATAYHEAAHAAVRYAEGRAVRSVSIIPGDDGSLGRVTHAAIVKRVDHELTPRQRRAVESDLLVLMAGPAAEAHLDGRKSSTWWGGDLDMAFDWVDAIGFGSAEEESAWLNWKWVQARQFVTTPYVWSLVVALAEALLDRGFLTGREVREVFDRTEASEWRVSR